MNISTGTPSPLAKSPPCPPSQAGINVHRFANRIPLLFEGGSDVITKTALKRINWSTYKINQNSDKVRGEDKRGVGAGRLFGLRVSPWSSCKGVGVQAVKG